MKEKKRINSYIIALDGETFQMLIDIINDYTSLVVLREIKSNYSFKELDEIRSALISAIEEGENWSEV